MYSFNKGPHIIEVAVVQMHAGVMNWEHRKPIARGNERCVIDNFVSDLLNACITKWIFFNASIDNLWSNWTHVYSKVVIDAITINNVGIIQLYLAKQVNLRIEHSCRVLEESRIQSSWSRFIAVSLV